MDLQKGQKQGRDEKTQEYYPTMRYDDGVQCNTVVSFVHFNCCVQSELGMQVHWVGGQRGGRHHSVEGYKVILSFFIPALFLSFL